MIPETLRLLSDNWFLQEPAFFSLYCQQQLEENVRMDCPIRCGQGRIEYNPLIIKHKNYAETEQLMRIELIRLFLKHPYEREPEGCCREAMSIGSNITIADGYCVLHKEKLPLHDPSYYHLPLGQYYEWYAKEIQKQSGDDEQRNPSNRNTQDSATNSSSTPSRTPDNSDSQDNSNQHNPEAPNADLSALWREDSLQRQKINELIERTSDWGTMPADLVERIKASTKASINKRQVMEGFRSSMLSSHRQLTRMRPNRRTGFLQMGSTRQFDSRLLVAIDTSGSITTEMLADFYSSINRLFRYGIVQIDVCQFDAQMGPIVPMIRAQQEVTVTGRGGTNYQPLFDYIQQGTIAYDGLLILTDGQAPPPVIAGQATGQSRRAVRIPVLWVCQNKQCYEQSHSWMLKTGRCCYL